MGDITFDRLSATKFEEFCHDVLHANGFVNIEWRKGTGLASSPADKGRDIVCELPRSEVASRLPDNQLWQSVDSLVKRKIVSKKSAEDFGNSFLAANATLRSQAILNGVVIPYLKGELNCQ